MTFLTNHRHLWLILCCMATFVATLPAQTTILFEDFENNCAQGCLADTYGGWSITSTGTEGSCPNTFFISCAENGNNAGVCGTGCGSDESLHISNQACSPWAVVFCPTGDCGAVYDADATCDAFSCAFGFCDCSGVSSLSDRRAELPVNLSGYANLNISFVYMEEGSGTADDATFQYFDGGAWNTIALPKTLNGSCGGQGLWTTFTAPLPAVLNNNPNARIGFRWVNNSDGAGTDPSFAVDDIRITGDPVLEAPGPQLTAQALDQGIQLQWESSQDHAREEPAVLLHRSGDAPFAVLSHGPATQYLHRQPGPGIHQYRLRWQSPEGQPVHGKILTFAFQAQGWQASLPHPNPVRQGQVRLDLQTDRPGPLHWQLTDLQGRTLRQGQQEIRSTQQSFDLDMDQLAAGAYWLHLRHQNTSQVRQIWKQ